MQAPHLPLHTDDDQQELQELLAALVGNWRSLLAAPLLACVLTLGATYLIQPTFTATATLIPPQQSQSSALAALSSLGAMAGLAGGAAGIKNPADQYVALMQSVSVSDRMIDRFELMKVYDAKYRVLARKELAQRVQITAGKKDGLISVDVEDTSPQRAADMANHYVDELRRMTAELAVTEAQQRRVFFEKQLHDTRNKLAAAQAALQRSGINPGALKAEPKAAAENYARLQAELTSAQVRLQTLRASRADSSAEVQQQLTTVQALRGQLQSLESATRSTSGQAASDGDADYISAYRDFKYQETLFDLMARQYELARVDESREGALIQVVDAAQPPELKSKPKRALWSVMAMLATGLGYALWLIARHQWHRFRASPANVNGTTEIQRQALGG